MRQHLPALSLVFEENQMSGSTRYTREALEEMLGGVSRYTNELFERVFRNAAAHVREFANMVVDAEGLSTPRVRWSRYDNRAVSILVSTVELAAERTLGLDELDKTLLAMQIANWINALHTANEVCISHCKFRGCQHGY